MTLTNLVEIKRISRQRANIKRVRRTAADNKHDGASKTKIKDRLIDHMGPWEKKINNYSTSSLCSDRPPLWILECGEKHR